jgi:hypothetical protein
VAVRRGPIRPGGADPLKFHSSERAARAGRKGEMRKAESGREDLIGSEASGGREAEANKGKTPRRRGSGRKRF